MFVTESPLERELRVNSALWRAGRFSRTKAPLAPVRANAAVGVPAWQHRTAGAPAHSGARVSASSDDPEPAGAAESQPAFDPSRALARISTAAQRARQSREWEMGSRDAARPSTLETAQAISALQDIDRLLAWADNTRAELVVAVAGTEPQSLAEARELTGRSLEDVGAAELGAALRMSTNASLGLAFQSRALCLWLPTVRSLMSAGDVSRAKMRIVVDGAAQLWNYLPEQRMTDPAVIEAMARFDGMVTPGIARKSAPQLKQVVRLAIQRIAAVTVEERHARAVENRSIEMWEVGDGMSMLQAMLPTLAATRVWNVLEHHARAVGEARGVDAVNALGSAATSHAARMADALVEIIDGTSELPPERRNEVAQVQVVVGIGTLLGASEDGAHVNGGRGWLTADTVRELARDSALRRLIVDDVDGQLLQFGRSTYRPPAALRDHVRARDVMCRAPGCTRDAAYCDIDHIVPWDSGGTTDESNLAVLCRRHHVLKTFGGWQYRLGDDGQAEWLLPSGLEVSDTPTPVLQVVDDDPPF